MIGRRLAFSREGIPPFHSSKSVPLRGAALPMGMAHRPSAFPRVHYFNLPDGNLVDEVRPYPNGVSVLGHLDNSSGRRRAFSLVF